MMRLLGQLLLTLLLAAATLAGVFAFNRAAAPPLRRPPAIDATRPDYQRIARVTDVQAVQRHHAALSGAGNRFTGSAGARRAADHIAARLRAAGYDVIRQPLRVTVPRTRRATLRNGDGEAIPGVQVYPILPNWFRTPTTPGGGISGQLVRGEQGLAWEFEGVDLRGKLALLPAGAPWQTVARLGAAAILYHETDEDVGHDWPHHLRASVNVPRVMVRGNVASLVGRTVTLDVGVDFEPVETENIIGVRKAGAEANDALIFTAPYDAYSYVPDLAPGQQAAVSPAVLLAAAEALRVPREQQSRDVVVVFTAARGQALAGARQFAAAVGNRDRQADNLAALRDAMHEINAESTALERVAALFADEAYWKAAGSAPAELRDTVKQIGDAGMARWLLVENERVEAARLEWIEAGMPAGTGRTGVSTFEAYQSIRSRFRQIEAVSRQSIAERRETLDNERMRVFREHVIAALEARRDETAFEQRELTADLAIAEALADRRLLNLNLDLTLDAERLALVCGEPKLRSQMQPADSELTGQLQEAVASLAGDAAEAPIELVNAVRMQDARNLSFVHKGYGAPMYFASSALLHGGHAAFTLASMAPRPTLGTPGDIIDPQAADTQWPAVAFAAQTIAATIEQLARGQGRIVPIGLSPDALDLRGRVVSQLGDNLVPSHPMPGALLRFDALVSDSRLAEHPPGVGGDMVLSADSAGRFSLEHVWGHGLSGAYWPQVHLDAALIDASNGAITWTLSEPLSGAAGAYRVRAVQLKQLAGSLATVVLFRAAPVQVFPMPDPRTLKPFAGMTFLNADDLAPPKDFKVERDASGTTVCYVPQGERLIATFKQGLPEAPNLLRTVAFALNMAEHADTDQPRSLPGAGFPPDDAKVIRNIEVDAAASMAAVNGQRVAKQAKRGLADDLLVRYTEQAETLADEAATRLAEGRPASAQQSAWQSLAYSSTVYPWVRNNTTDAIWGIVFYLFLAIPFVVFLEKLLIGTPDIRKQIAWIVVFFLLFFLLLAMLHPAYELVRSPYVILLGFVTLALALFVGGFVAARFSRNVTRALRRSNQQIEAADVSRASAAATAFALGLNNLRRRPMRTGLTMLTLIFITFVMIAFTSVRTDVVDQRIPIGNASYSGLLIRDPRLGDIRPRLAPLQEIYGRTQIVCPRGWVGSFDVQAGQIAELAQIPVAVEGDDDEVAQAQANAILGLTVDETKLLPLREACSVWARWFRDDDEAACLLPRLMADQLQISAAEVQAGEATVTLSGRDYQVIGLFEEGELERLVDLDGESILPLDVRMLSADPTQRAARTGQTLAAPTRVPRLPAGQVVIAALGALPGKPRIASIAVGLQPDMPYARKRETIISHLERSGQMTYFGLDGVSYLGARMRHSSLTGLIDMLLPILIAALTVLNTMYGSVYERRDELYVFNSVGLAPNHVRWLFFAEALVYAVVGVVGGYLLAQSISFILRTFDLTAGLSMNYSSLTGVLVSATIMLVVLLSSLLPARLAAKLAAPSETMSRKREGGESDVLQVDLPFTFNRRDTAGIIPYFVDWFEEFGESSAGAFSATPPQVGLTATPDGEACPVVTTTTWLKPYDLGVSQKVRLTVQLAEATGDHIAVLTITRQSGDRDNWQRCCHRFLGLLRRRMLTWRGVSLEDRAALHDRACQMLDPDSDPDRRASTPQEPAVT